MDARVLALAGVASDIGTKYALNSVCFRKKEGGGIEATATDGRVLISAEFGAGKLAEGMSPELPHDEVIVPVEALRRARRMIASLYPRGRKARTPTLTLLNDKPDDLVLSIRDDQGRQADIHTTPVEGIFPKADGLWPSGSPAAMVMLEAHLFGKALAAVAALAKSRSGDAATITVTIFPTPEGTDHPPVLLEAKAEDGLRVRGLVMPIKQV
jgi:hypothetical protein